MVGIWVHFSHDQGAIGHIYIYIDAIFTAFS